LIHDGDGSCLSPPGASGFAGVGCGVGAVGVVDGGVGAVGALAFSVGAGKRCARSRSLSSVNDGLNS
jgi:hypothetical protein